MFGVFLEPLSVEEREDLNVKVEHVTVEHVTVEHVTVEHVTVEHVTVEHVTVEHVTVEHVTVEHVTVEHVTVEHVTVEHLTVEHVTVEHNRQIKNKVLYVLVRREILYWLQFGWGLMFGRCCPYTTSPTSVYLNLRQYAMETFGRLGLTPVDPAMYS